MIFQIPITGVVRPVVAIVAAHGITDLDTPAWRWPYALVCAIPDPAVTALFFTASVIHFAMDVGARQSVGLHVVTAALWYSHGIAIAFHTMLAWLFVHTWLHYRRCFVRKRFTALAIATIATTATLLAIKCVLPEPTTTLVVGSWAQRIAIAHIVTELVIHP
jgi:hypothetical protein